VKCYYSHQNKIQQVSLTVSIHSASLQWQQALRKYSEWGALLMTAWSGGHRVQSDSSWDVVPWSRCSMHQDVSLPSGSSTGFWLSAPGWASSQPRGPPLLATSSPT
jgi:hypothetical protein